MFQKISTKFKFMQFDDLYGPPELEKSQSLSVTTGQQGGHINHYISYMESPMMALKYKMSYSPPQSIANKSDEFSESSLTTSQRQISDIKIKTSQQPELKESNSNSSRNSQKAKSDEKKNEKHRTSQEEQQKLGNISFPSIMPDQQEQYAIYYYNFDKNQQLQKPNDASLFENSKSAETSKLQGFDSLLLSPSISKKIDERGLDCVSTYQDNKLNSQCNQNSIQNDIDNESVYHNTKSNRNSRNSKNRQPNLSLNNFIDKQKSGKLIANILQQCQEEEAENQKLKLSQSNLIAQYKLKQNNNQQQIEISNEQGNQQQYKLITKDYYFDQAIGRLYSKLSLILILTYDLLFDSHLLFRKIAHIFFVSQKENSAKQWNALLFLQKWIDLRPRDFKDKIDLWLCIQAFLDFIAQSESYSNDMICLITQMKFSLQVIFKNTNKQSCLNTIKISAKKMSIEDNLQQSSQQIISLQDIQDKEKSEHSPQQLQQNLQQQMSQQQQNQIKTREIQQEKTNKCKSRSNSQPKVDQSEKKFSEDDLTQYFVEDCGPIIIKDYFSNIKSLENKEKEIFFLLDAKVFVQQCCLIDQKMYNSLIAKDLLSEKRLKPKKQQQKQFHYNVFQHITPKEDSIKGKIIQRINLLCYFIILIIIQQESQANQVRVINKLLQISDQSLENQNYNLLLILFLAMNHHIVQRQFESIYSKLSIRAQQSWKKLDDTINFFKNYKSLREQIQQAHPPYIPCLNILSKNVLLIDGYEDDYIEENKVKYINVNKMEMLSDQLYDFYRMREADYSFDKSRIIYNFLKNGYINYIQLYLNISADRKIDIQLYEIFQKSEQRLKLDEVQQSTNKKKKKNKHIKQ